MILTTPRITTSVKQYNDTVHAGGTDWDLADTVQKQNLLITDQ